MHVIQSNILKLARREDLSKLGYRKLGEKIGVSHPQQVKHHLQKLIDTGRLVRTPFGVLRAATPSNTLAQILQIPILGQANCGQPLSLAEESDWGALTLSPSLAPTKDVSKLFAVKAVGDSMNRANVSGANIEDGDYIVVDGGNTAPGSGAYVVSSVGGLANVKKYVRDEANRLIRLVSESSREYAPIVMDPNDVNSYQVHGTVLRVIKAA
ncbi:MAG TPA: S24 family peptidase [Candidatus Saccharimonadales bacterium]